MGTSKMPTLSFRNASSGLLDACAEIAVCRAQKIMASTLPKGGVPDGAVNLLMLHPCRGERLSLVQGHLLASAIADFDAVKLAFFREHIPDFRAFEAALGDLVACPLPVVEEPVATEISAADRHVRQIAVKRDDIFRHIVGDPTRLSIWDTPLPDDQ